MYQESHENCSLFESQHEIGVNPINSNYWKPWRLEVEDRPLIDTKIFNVL